MSETLDDNFKAEMLDFKNQMLRFAEVANQKFDGLTDDVRSVTYRIDKLEASSNARFDRLENNVSAVAEKVNLMSKQFKAVAGKVMTNDQRLDGLESRVDVLEGEAH
jgi:outer membrane murein-binding lipoprotein Lpp